MRANKQTKPLILDLRSVNNFQFSSPAVSVKSRPLIKPVTVVEPKPARKAKTIAKYIYGDNDKIVINPKWAAKNKSQ